MGKSPSLGGGGGGGITPNAGNKCNVALLSSENPVSKELTLTQVYQPIINHVQGELLGYEALSRPYLGDSLVAPDLWFRSTYEQGWSVEVDLHVLRNVFEMQNVNHNVNVPMFVNVSPISLLNPDFCSALQRLLLDTRMPPELLVIEIVEYVPYNPSALLLPMQLIQSLGVRIALDDLGEGTANFYTLSLLKPDFVKLDRSLIQGIARSSSKQESLSAALEYIGAKETVIVEGIESKDDLDMVRELGVHLSQGYYWSEPRPMDELSILLWQIRLKREKLKRVVDEQRGHLSDPVVLEESRQLDALINEYEKRRHRSNITVQRADR